MSEIEKYYNGEIIVDFEEETELEKNYNEVAELYSKAVKKKIEYRKEIERLSNIINELEKWCKEQAKDFRENNKPFCYEYESIADEYENILDKIQELKGDGSNE